MSDRQNPVFFLHKALTIQRLCAKFAPYKGCDEDTLNAIISMNVPKISMISCNHATAARDCKYLAEHGYKVEFVQPFDMFPRTKHVECVILLTK